MVPSPSSADPWTGRVVGGRWRILSLLDDSGGMASVYLADDERLPRKAVVKIPKAAHQNTEFVERFAREAFWHAQVENLHVVHVLDRGEEAGTPFLVLQYLPGGNLKAWCERNPSILADPRLHHDSWLLPIARALDAVAAKGIVHRDVKPSNVLFDSGSQAYLSDFGIVKGQGDGTLAKTGTLIGTLQFMSPEQCHDEQRRSLDGRSDQYGLAVTTYQVLTGWKYPVADDTAVIYAAKFGLSPMKQPRDHEPRIPVAVNDAVMRALSTDRERRFASCVEFARAVLAGFGNPAVTTGGSAPVPVRPPAVSQPAPPTGRGSGTPSGPSAGTDKRRTAGKRPLEVTIAGWWITVSGLCSLGLSILDGSSPMPMSSFALVFGGALVSTICGIGILYGDNLARLTFCAVGITGILGALAAGQNVSLILVSLVPFGLCLLLLFSPQPSRYFSGRGRLDSPADDSHAPGRFVQVVGRDCTSCARRISDATTANPCAGCARPLHHACATDVARHACAACAIGTVG